MPVQTGTPKREYTDEEKADIVEKVCQFYESQNCTLESACQAAGIGDRTFLLWRTQNADFAERFKKARNVQQSEYWETIIQPKAASALQRLLEGEKVFEKKVKRERVKLPGAEETALVETELVETEKEILPNASVVIFVTKGLYPERFTDHIKTDATVQVVQDTSWFAQLPFEQQLEVLRIKNQAKNAATAEPEKS